MATPTGTGAPATHETYKVEARALTTIHVGAGGPPYLRDVDFVVREQAATRPGAPLQTVATVVDIDALLEALPEERLAALAGRPLGETLPIAERASPESTIVLRRLTITDNGSPAEVRPCTRDAFGLAYLPGSSLKGAMRSALFWKNPPNVEVDRLDRRVTWAAGNVENEQFAGEGRGQLQNRSLLRALRVGDCYPTTPSPAGGAAVGIFAPAGEGAGRRLETRRPTFYLEGLPFDVRFLGSLTLDMGLLAGAERLRFPQAEWLSVGALVTACRERAAELIDFELAFYRDHAVTDVANLYASLQILQGRLQPMQFLLAVGFGTGWQAKTLGRRLTPEQIDAIQRRYPGPLELWRHNPAFPRLFPKTRKLVVGPNGRPVQPLGWLQVTLTEARRA